MDGVRAFWNGKELLSKQGNEVPCPKWFIEGLPQDVGLDGELWIGRNKYEDLKGVLNSMDNENSLWRSVKYVVFDLPFSSKPYENRMDDLKDINLPPHVRAAEVEQCRGSDHLFKYLTSIVVEKGGEGLMAVEPQSLYTGGRTNRLLKVKVQNDSEVQVLEILPTGLHCLQ